VTDSVSKQSHLVKIPEVIFTLEEVFMKRCLHLICLQRFVKNLFHVRSQALLFNVDSCVRSKSNNIAKLVNFLNLWLLQPVTFHEFQYFFCCLVTIFNRHINIHDDKLVSSIFTFAGFFQCFFDHVDCDLPVLGLKRFDVKFRLDHEANCHHVEFCVLDD
jgi:hypothetical protein